MKEPKPRESIQSDIAEAIGAICDDITGDANAETNKIRAEAILVLTTAYKLTK